jgi:Alginate export
VTAYGTRRRIRAVLQYFFLVLSPAHANPCWTAGPVVPDRTYQLLPSDENWSFLRDPALREDFWDPIKYIRLRNNRDDWYLSIGGETRQDWERIGNDNWGEQPFQNAFFLQRYMGHLDVHYGEHFRSFVQLKSGIETFRQGGPRPIDEKRLDFEAGFLDICTGGERNWIAFRAGRQELNYGSGRLVSVREGPNVRQSFDGFKIMSEAGSWHIDGFAVRPDFDHFGFFDNNPDNQTGFWGIYSTRPLRRNVSMDLYITSASILTRLPTSGALLPSCVTPWAHVCGAPSRKRNPVGTLIMKPCGNSGVLDRQISGRGASPRKQGTACQLCH